MNWPAPDRVVLHGRYASLVPLQPEHAEDLFAASAPDRFRYLFEDPPGSVADISDWIARSVSVADPMFFATIDRSSGAAVGRQALMRVDAGNGVIEVGNILWGPAMVRTRVATESLFLLAEYAFDTLGYRRFEWKCNNDNEPSKRAAARFGFTPEGVFRQHMWVKGANRDTAWFSIIDREWPRLREEYHRWLEPSNFDAEGRQRTPLGCA